MSIEIKCSGCGQVLRVQDQDAGKQARCPKCKTTFAIPSSESSGAGPTIGGVDLNPGTPVSQGQVPNVQQPFSQQPFSQQPFGQSAQQEFGQPGQNPFGDKPGVPTQNPYAAPQASFPQVPRRGYRQPHRGGQILTFGILGLLCCGLFGIAAWVMGNEDLKKMDAGIMDPAGRGTTQAGRVIGIICAVLMVISLFANVALMAVGGL